ncbi:hypothetical protein LJC74_07545 [Eubacteriales bacterium OttesenSCG-928-A19]|nr:hypothetical protein [Eubacteriales bacterium OttesenSCG-928-A19]
MFTQHYKPHTVFSLARICSQQRLRHFFMDWTFVHMIQQGFIEAFNAISVDKEQFRQDYQAIVDYLSDTAALDKTIAAAQADCDVTMGLLKKMVDENTQATQDQGTFSDRYNALTAKFDAAKERLQDASEEKQSRMARKARGRVPAGVGAAEAGAGLLGRGAFPQYRGNGECLPRWGGQLRVSGWV